MSTSPFLFFGSPDETDASDCGLTLDNGADCCHLDGGNCHQYYQGEESRRDENDIPEHIQTGLSPLDAVLSTDVDTPQEFEADLSTPIVVTMGGSRGGDDGEEGSVRRPVAYGSRQGEENVRAVSVDGGQATQRIASEPCQQVDELEPIPLVQPPSSTFFSSASCPDNTVSSQDRAYSSSASTPALAVAKPPGASPKGAGAQVIRYKKAPQAPRRFKSAYMFFSTSKHKEIRPTVDEKVSSPDASLVSASMNSDVILFLWILWTSCFAFPLCRLPPL
jgi:hypothetical protein